MVIYLRPASAEQMEMLAAEPERLEEFMFAEDDELVDFDKAWHMLHFLLTGSDGATDSPLSIIIDGTDAVGTDANGFGGFWPISAVGMRRFAEALGALPDEELASRLDRSAMMAGDVYLSDAFDGEDDVEILDYVLQGMPALRRLADTCVATNRGAIKVLG